MWGECRCGCHRPHEGRASAGHVRASDHAGGGIDIGESCAAALVVGIDDDAISLSVIK